MLFSASTKFFFLIHCNDKRLTNFMDVKCDYKSIVCAQHCSHMYDSHVSRFYLMGNFEYVEQKKLS